VHAVDVQERLVGVADVGCGFGIAGRSRVAVSPI